MQNENENEIKINMGGVAALGIAAISIMTPFARKAVRRVWVSGARFGFAVGFVVASLIAAAVWLFWVG